MTQLSIRKNSVYRTLTKVGIFFVGACAAHGAFSGPTPVIGDYRSVAAGNLDSPGIWEQLTASGWSPIATAPVLASGNTVFILHAINGNAATNTTKITVSAGGTFTAAAGTNITEALVIENGGQLQVNQQLTFASAAVFSVENGGIVTINTAQVSPETGIWNGTENFGPTSTFRIKAWNASLPVLNADVAFSANLHNGLAAVFGNLQLNFGNSAVSGLQLMTGTFSKNLAHGNLEIISAGNGSSVIVGGSNSAVNGNLIVENGFAGCTLFLATSQITVKGNVVQKSGTVFASRGTAPATTLNLNGNLTISGGSFDLSPVNPTSTATVSVNLAGNLEIATSALLTNTFVSGADAGRVALNLNGTVPQSLKAFSTITNVPFRVVSGATVVLGAIARVNRSTVSTIVQTGGTLDFNGFNFEGTSGFTQMAGATLRITSPLGIDADGGNVQSSLNGRKFDKDGIYHFTGTVPQITGNGLNPASGQKTIIVDNPTSVTVTQPVSISTSGGLVDIRQGALLETESGYVSITNSSNSVQLKMAANTVYRTAALVQGYSASHYSFPQTGGTWTLDPTSTIELSGNGPQVLRSSSTSKVYGNLTFSNSGTKTLANNVANIAGTVTIKDAAVLDAQANSFGGTATNFTMTGGRFRTSRSSTQPMMNGVYNLTGGVVEFYGTTSTSATQTVRGGKTYFNIEISAEEANTNTYNVLHGAGMVTVAGEFKINAPAVYQIAGSNNYIAGAAANAGSFVMQPGATLKYGDKYGITNQACGTSAACGNIRTPQRQFPDNASYGVIGTSTGMVTGSGLPNSVANFYLDRANTNLVTLTNPLKIVNTLIFKNGKLKTTENSVVQFAENAESIGASAVSYVSGPVSKVGKSAFSFPIGNDAYYAPAGVEEAESENTILAQYIGQSAATPITQNPANQLSSPLLEIGVNECWKISRTAGTAPVQVALTWETSRSGEIANPENLVVARLNNSSYWISEGVADQDPTQPENQITASRKSNSLGYFALGHADALLGFTTLPVELVSFSARLQDQNALLSWVTASEKNNAYFEVERSADGNLYKPVGRIESKGNSGYTQTYAFTDYEAVNGHTYYRLRQTDLDGTTTLSKPVVLDRNEAEPNGVTAYPNPAQGFTNVRFYNEQPGPVEIRVLTANGRLVSEKTSYAGSGLIAEMIPLTGALPGIYLIEVTTATGKEIIRVENF